MDPVVDVCVLVFVNVETRKDDTRITAELIELRAEFKKIAQHVVQLAIASDTTLGEFEKYVQVLLQTGRRIDANFGVNSRYTKLSCVVVDCTTVDKLKEIEDSVLTVHCDAFELHIHTEVVEMLDIVDIHEATPVTPPQLAAEKVAIIAHVFFTA